MTNESESADTSAKRPVVRVRGIAELLASLPQILGFRPAESVILLADIHPGSRKYGPVIRADLPAAGDERALACQLAAAVSRSRAISVTTAVLGELTGGGDAERHDLPWRALVEAIGRELRERGIDHAAAVWAPCIAGGVGWRSYQDARLGGVLPEPESTVAAARAVESGLVTFRSREDLRELVEPDSSSQGRARAEVVAERIRARRAARTGPCSPENARAVVADALGRSLGGDLAFTDDELAELALALSDRDVRDSFLAAAAPERRELARAAARLWQLLCRTLPAPERAQAAALAGYAAYASGEGALARMALEVALDTDPSHVLAALLMRALGGGIEPRTIRRIARGRDELDRLLPHVEPDQQEPP
ncbi:protein of unknown function [Haloechinothrix alba]|uniref:DUF4192 domain-containing protein n=1 Tax=Haloechinothrix alba TaxID=664784 RepID=A0A238X5R8_9PSEU|nr:DUF4192 domain-containing protein [Haloechinothrix alba]SNR54040.1 protein of unknown function [Haloechinothrix alba]